MPGSNDRGGDEDPAPLHGGEGQVRDGRQPRPSAGSPSSWPWPSVRSSAWPWRQTRVATAPGSLT